MLQPMDMPPASWAPRLAASMMPGPPPVMMAKPLCAKRNASRWADRYIGSSGRGAGRAENRDGGAHFRESVEGMDELALDAQDAPRIAMSELRLLGQPRDRTRGPFPFQQQLVFGFLAGPRRSAQGDIGNVRRRRAIRGGLGISFFRHAKPLMCKSGTMITIWPNRFLHGPLTG